jgi:Tol biopolymer transport system component
MQGSPRAVTRDVGQITPQGFTEDGSFYFNRSSRRFTTQTAQFDSETGKLQNESFKPLLGSYYNPEWSPDGKYLAYVEEQIAPAGPGWYRRPLHVLNVRTREDRILASDLAVRIIRWSPDGRSVLVTGQEYKRRPEENNNGGLYKIDIQKDWVTELVKFPPVEDWSKDLWSSSACEWSLDGTMIFYTISGRIKKRELQSGEETLLYDAGDLRLARALDLSPDGGELAFSTALRDGGQARIMSIPVTGGEPKKLCGFEETTRGTNVHRSVTWTPDGDWVLFTKSEEKGSTVWRVNIDSGDRQLIWDSRDRVTSLGIHPDGDKIAVSTYAREHSVWVMENFLPTAVASADK